VQLDESEGNFDKAPERLSFQGLGYDATRMDCLPRQELSIVSRVGGDDNPVVCESTADDLVVAMSPEADVYGMHGVGVSTHG
jgi:hypothetical protein